MMITPIFPQVFLTKSIHAVADSHIRSYLNFCVPIAIHSPFTSTSKKSEYHSLVVPEVENFHPTEYVKKLLRTSPEFKTNLQFTKSFPVAR